MIGLGGGSLVKFIRKYSPETRITVVEIDDRVIAAARAHFEVPPNDDTLQVIEADGALYIRQQLSVNVILLDGFDGGNQVETLATESFYAACRRALKPGGVLVVNLWGRDANFSEYLDRLIQVFEGQVGWLSIMGKTNIVVFAFADNMARASWLAAPGHVPILTQRYGLDFAGWVREFQWCKNP